MLELFRKHKTMIIRTMGALMLLIGFMTYFWTTPKKGLSESDIAAANVARMEASVRGSSQVQSKQPQNKSPFLEKYKSTQEKQIRYFLIMLMVGGTGFLIYSFVKKKEKE